MGYFQLTAHIGNTFFRIGYACSCNFCTVHGRTTAESNDGLTVVVKIGFSGALNVFNGRICLNITENSADDMMSSKCFKQFVWQPETSDRIAGDEQYTLKMLIF
ncbi:hypothetical protein SDC9_134359 [bioreactor metagenome]|uniref:Uncharacterized protein n=1 Tax=bioreactor metagenome TaxID=1076179 RepID=A0A645DEI8_9ZZZZ